MVEVVSAVLAREYLVDNNHGHVLQNLVINVQWPQTFPYTLDCWLYLVVEGDFNDAGNPLNVTLHLIDGQTDEIVDECPAGVVVPTTVGLVYSICILPSPVELTIPRRGHYQVAILLSGEEKKRFWLGATEPRHQGAERNSG
jgi:hypothetical protein